MFGTNFMPFLYGYLRVIAFALFDPYWGIAPFSTPNNKILKIFFLYDMPDNYSFQIRKK